VKRIDAPTRWVLIQPRVHVAGRNDLPVAKAVLDAITVEGLAEADGRKAPAVPAYHYAAPEFSDAKLPVSALAFEDPLQFWQVLADAPDREPAAARSDLGAPAAVRVARDRVRQALEPLQN
jgi:hypothetical protein